MGGRTATSSDEIATSEIAISEGLIDGQLLSFSAFACLSARERLAALLCEDTEERLRWAVFALGRRARRLLAEVSLCEVVGDRV